MHDLPPLPDDAVLSAIESNSLTPIIKHNLAAKVRCTRRKNGKEDINVLFEEPKKFELTEEEEVKILRRKQRNRESAEKARLKSKAKGEALEKEVRDLENEQRSLKSEIGKLKSELRSEKQKFYSHLLLGKHTSFPCRHPKFQHLPVVTGSFRVSAGVSGISDMPRINGNSHLPDLNDTPQLTASLENIADILCQDWQMT